jgi:hypothetical protein
MSRDRRTLSRARPARSIDKDERQRNANLGQVLESIPEGSSRPALVAQAVREHGTDSAKRGLYGGAIEL